MSVSYQYINFILGIVSSTAIGFCFELYRTHQPQELTLPMIFILILVFVIKAIEEKWLQPNVQIIKQYETEIGIEAKEGKTSYLVAYKASIQISSYISGFAYGWTFVVLAAIAT